MNIKPKVKIALFLFSPLVISAGYDVLDKDQNKFLNLQSTPAVESFIDRSFFEQQFSHQQTAIKKQAYLEIIGLINNNQLEEAKTKISNLILQHPEEAEFHNMEAVLEIIKKDTDLAIKSYQKAIDLNPQNIKAHLGLAKLFLDKKDLSQAKRHAEKALSINDNVIYTYFLLADISRGQNRIEDIESILLNAQEKAKGKGNLKQEIKVAKNLLKLYVSRKQPEKVLPIAQDIIKRNPDNSLALSFLATTQFYNNRKASAIQSLEKLTKQEIKDIPHRLLLAKLLLEKPENKKKIVKLLDEITAIAPDNVQILVQKIALLNTLKKFKATLISVKKLKALLPESGLPYALEGDIYLAEKKMDKALTAYSKAYELKPTGQILRMLSDIMVGQSRQSDAIAFLNKELKKDKRNITAHLSLASIYEQQHNAKETEKHYLAILAEQPDNSVALNNLAWLYHQQNNSKALVLAEKAYKNSPDSPYISDTFATFLVEKGDIEKGIKIFEKAVLLAPNVYNIQYHLANAYALKGMNNLAINRLNGIVKSNVEFTEKNEAKNLLKKLNAN